MKQIEVFFHASMAALGFEDSLHAERGQEVLKREKETGGSFPLTGDDMTPRIQGQASKERLDSRFRRLLRIQ